MHKQKNVLALPHSWEADMTEPTAAEALDEARADITYARIAASGGDNNQRSHYAQSAIDAAAVTLLDPSASARQVVAARFYLAEGLALDGRRNECGADTIHTDEEAQGLCEEDQRWLDDYLANRQSAHCPSCDYSLGR
jgi:hypothetical protein